MTELGLILSIVLGAAPQAPPAPAATDVVAPEAVPAVTQVAPPRRVCVIIDPFRWVTGEVVKEDDFTITVLDRGTEVEINKVRAMHIVPLLELPAPQPGIISLRDGSSLRATIVSDSYEGVTYEIAQLRNLLKREHVLSVTLLPSMEEQLAKLKLTIPPGDVSRRLQLARWLLQEARPDLAIIELEQLAVDSPSHDAVRSLLEVARRANESRLTVSPAEEGSDGVAPNNPYIGRLLTPEEVNLIRVFEVDLNDPPRLTIDPSTVRDLLTQYSTSKVIPAEEADRERLVRADSVEVLRLMFALKAREFYPRVKVVNDPTSLRLFARNVYTRWLIPNCATSRCHGGTDAGDFFLHGSDSNDDRVRTTNLMTLLRKEIDGTPLVDFGSPRDSLVIQYGLPRHLARTPHPAVKGWTPALGRAADRMAAEAEMWIRSMYQPRPDYMVDWEPPARPRVAPDDPANSEVR